MALTNVAKCDECGNRLDIIDQIEGGPDTTLCRKCLGDQPLDDKSESLLLDAVEILADN